MEPQNGPDTRMVVHQGPSFRFHVSECSAGVLVNPHIAVVPDTSNIPRKSRWGAYFGLCVTRGARRPSAGSRGADGGQAASGGELAKWTSRGLLSTEA